MQPRPLLGDCQYGHSGPLRQGLREASCPYMLQVGSALKVWVERPQLRLARKRQVPKARGPQAQTVLEVGRSLPGSAWRPCRWSGTRGKTFSTRLAWIRAWMVSDLDEDSGEIPETWLVFDWPQDQPEPYHIYTAWLDGPPERISLLRLSRQRFQIEQYFQRDKDDLGLDHFEGRSWRGFHHHLSLAATAYLFVLLVFLRAKKTSSLTWEEVLRRIRPFLIRSRGFRSPMCLPFRHAGLSGRKKRCRELRQDFDRGFSDQGRLVHRN